MTERKTVLEKVLFYVIENSSQTAHAQQSVQGKLCSKTSSFHLKKLKVHLLIPLIEHKILLLKKSEL